MPPTATPTPAGQTFTGQGKQATAKFKLGDGLAIFRMTHNGSQAFSVLLVNGQGKHVLPPVNVTGALDGARGQRERRQRLHTGCAGR